MGHGLMAGNPINDRQSYMGKPAVIVKPGPLIVGASSFLYLIHLFQYRNPSGFFVCKFLVRAAETGNTTHRKAPICTIAEAEPIGPKSRLDLLVICPCTGNTLAKLANGITDTPVLMAAKAHLRNDKPILLAISTNDALGMNMKNIGLLMNSKNIYFLPFCQDAPDKKPNSMVACMEFLIPSIEAALEKRQIQPVIR